MAVLERIRCFLSSPRESPPEEFKSLFSSFVSAFPSKGAKEAERKRFVKTNEDKICGIVLTGLKHLQSHGKEWTDDSPSPPSLKSFYTGHISHILRIVLHGINQMVRLRLFFRKLKDMMLENWILNLMVLSSGKSGNQKIVSIFFPVLLEEIFIHSSPRSTSKDALEEIVEDIEQLRIEDDLDDCAFWLAEEGFSLPTFLQQQKSISHLLSRGFLPASTWATSEVSSTIVRGSIEYLKSIGSWLEFFLQQDDVDVDDANQEEVVKTLGGQITRLYEEFIIHWFRHFGSVVPEKKSQSFALLFKSVQKIVSVLPLSNESSWKLRSFSAISLCESVEHFSFKVIFGDILRISPAFSASSAHDELEMSPHDQDQERRWRFAWEFCISHEPHFEDMMHIVSHLDTRQKSVSEIGFWVLAISKLISFSPINPEIIPQVHSDLLIFIQEYGRIIVVVKKKKSQSSMDQLLMDFLLRFGESMLWLTFANRFHIVMKTPDVSDFATYSAPVVPCLKSIFELLHKMSDFVEHELIRMEDTNYMWMIQFLLKVLREVDIFRRWVSQASVNDGFHDNDEDALSFSHPTWMGAPEDIDDPAFVSDFTLAKLLYLLFQWENRVGADFLHGSSGSPSLTTCYEQVFADSICKACLRWFDLIIHRTKSFDEGFETILELSNAGKEWTHSINGWKVLAYGFFKLVQEVNKVRDKFAQSSSFLRLIAINKDMLDQLRKSKGDMDHVDLEKRYGVLLSLEASVMETEGVTDSDLRSHITIGHNWRRKCSTMELFSMPQDSLIVQYGTFLKLMRSKLSDSSTQCSKPTCLSKMAFDVDEQSSMRGEYINSLWFECISLWKLFHEHEGIGFVDVAKWGLNEFVSLTREQLWMEGDACPLLARALICMVELELGLSVHIDSRSFLNSLNILENTVSEVYKDKDTDKDKHISTGVDDLDAVANDILCHCLSLHAMATSLHLHNSHENPNEDDTLEEEGEDNLAAFCGKELRHCLKRWNKMVDTTSPGSDTHVLRVIDSQATFNRMTQVASFFAFHGSAELELRVLHLQRSFFTDSFESRRNKEYLESLLAGKLNKCALALGFALSSDSKNSLLVDITGHSKEREETKCLTLWEKALDNLHTLLSESPDSLHSVISSAKELCQAMDEYAGNVALRGIEMHLLEVRVKLFTALALECNGEFDVAQNMSSSALRVIISLVKYSVNSHVFDEKRPRNELLLGQIPYEAIPHVLLSSTFGFEFGQLFAECVFRLGSEFEGRGMSLDAEKYFDVGHALAQWGENNDWKCAFSLCLSELKHFLRDYEKSRFYLEQSKNEREASTLCFYVDSNLPRLREKREEILMEIRECDYYKEHRRCEKAFTCIENAQKMLRSLCQKKIIEDVSLMSVGAFSTPTEKKKGTLRKKSRVVGGRQTLLPIEKTSWVGFETILARIMSRRAQLLVLLENDVQGALGLIHASLEMDVAPVDEVILWYEMGKIHIRECDEQGIVSLLWSSRTEELFSMVSRSKTRDKRTTRTRKKRITRGEEACDGDDGPDLTDMVGKADEWTRNERKKLIAVLKQKSDHRECGIVALRRALSICELMKAPSLLIRIRIGLSLLLGPISPHFHQNFYGAMGLAWEEEVLKRKELIQSEKVEKDVMSDMLLFEKDVERPFTYVCAEYEKDTKSILIARYDSGFVSPCQFRCSVMLEKDEDDSVDLVRTKGSGDHSTMRGIKLFEIFSDFEDESDSDKNVKRNRKEEDVDSEHGGDSEDDIEGETGRINGFSVIEKEFKNIMRENGRTLNPSETSKMTKDQWWKERFQLDERLSRLAQVMECDVLGPWRIAFLPLSADDTSIRTTCEYIKVEFSNVCKCLDDHFLVILVNGFAILKDEEIECILLELCHVDTMSVRSRRSIEKEIQNMISSLRASDSLSTMLSLRRHLVFSFGDAMQPFPWESMPFLWQQSISRVPSIHFFKHMKSNCPKGMKGLKEGIDIGSTCYMLNPGGDLTRTQTLFESIFSSNSQWVGWTGSPPAHEDFIDAVTKHDLFVYMGHGAGEKYLSSRVFDEIQDMCTCLLMGCSSGHLRDFGEFERRGTVLKYLGSGSPCVLASLWDITDADLDRFTAEMMYFITKEWENAGNEDEGKYSGDREVSDPAIDERRNVVEGFASIRAQTQVTKTKKLGKKKVGVRRTRRIQSREMRIQGEEHSDGTYSVTNYIPLARMACKLQHMIGSAMICYGFPVRFSHSKTKE
eukprot:TRINITY_DN1138_c0_g1_i3.p1 TRINITY_DN1138_c0_g1~~TRINITY_DN1138_c0_g1_i3.p1  ORF type:complete len:2269 (-),score=517.22 TRINITY_DN1138_c0_g1_i3:619-7284(-)